MEMTVCRAAAASAPEAAPPAAPPRVGLPQLRWKERSGFVTAAFNVEQRLRRRPPPSAPAAAVPAAPPAGRGDPAAPRCTCRIDWLSC